MQSIRDALNSLLAETLRRIAAGDLDGAQSAATAGKNMATAAEMLRVPLDAPVELLELLAKAAGLIQKTSADLEAEQSTTTEAA